MSELDDVNEKLIDNLTKQVDVLKDGLTSILECYGNERRVCTYCGDEETDSSSYRGCCGEVHFETEYSLDVGGRVWWYKPESGEMDFD